MESAMLTTLQVAQQLGVTRARIIAIIRAGRLPATRFGRAWVIAAADLAAYKPQPIGHPPKSKIAQP